MTRNASTQELALVHRTERFCHADACRMQRAALSKPAARTVVLDLAHAQEAETAAFAQLVLLRRSLLGEGRDLRLTGMRDRTASLYELNRLSGVLPRQ